MGAAPQSPVALAITASIFAIKLLQAAHVAWVLPYRGIWVNRMALFTLAIEAACGALLLWSHLQPPRASENAVGAVSCRQRPHILSCHLLAATFNAYLHTDLHQYPRAAIW